MKVSDKPQLSRKWWMSEKPSEIKGADLEKALQLAERAEADMNAGAGVRSIDARIAALVSVRTAAERTIKKDLDKKTHKEHIAVLEKYEGVIKTEIQRLENVRKSLPDQANGDGGDEEVSEDTLFEKDYLYKMIKLLKSTGQALNFGFGLDSKDPSASTLVLARKGKPERLFKALKKTGAFSNRLLTYGFAQPDPQDGKTLVFRLAESAGEPPQIQKLGRQFLRADKNLKYRKLKLVLPGGQTLDDNEPDVEEEAAAAADRGDRLSQHERDAIRDEIDGIERRLEQLMAEYQISV
jgi:hypothetical protein